MAAIAWLVIWTLLLAEKQGSMAAASDNEHPALDTVLTSAAEKLVLTSAAEQLVLTSAAEDPVLTSAAEDQVLISVAAEDPVLTSAAAEELLLTSAAAAEEEKLRLSPILGPLLVAVVGQNRGCHVHIVHDLHYSSQLASIAAEIHLHSNTASLQISLRNTSAGDDVRTSAAGSCRLYLLLLGSPASLLLRANSSELPVGDLWDQVGRYLLVSPMDTRRLVAAVSGPRGLLQNAAFFHVLQERPAAGGGRLSLFSRYDGQTRRLGWAAPGRTLPPLTPPPADFAGRPLRLVSFEHKPTTIYLDGTVDGRHAGVDPSVAEFAARLYNFTLTFSEPSDGLRWGDNGYGYWTGLIGDLVHRRAHFGMANLFITHSRSRIIDYSRPYGFERACFVVWRPPPLARWLAVVRPFSTSGWAAAAGLLVLSVLAVLLLGRAAAPRESPLFGQPGFVALYNLGGLVGISHASLPRVASGQFLLVAWRFCALTLAVMYSSKLISNLVVPLPPAPIDTVRQLALSGVTVSGYGSTFGELLNASSNYWDRQLARNYESTYDITSALKRVYDKKATYINSSGSLAYLILEYYTTASGEPLLRIMRQCFGNFMVGIALPRRSFLTPLLNAAVARLTEAGMRQHWSRRALLTVGRRLAVAEAPTDQQPAAQDSQQQRSLELDALQGPFLLLLIGWAAALLALLGELVTARCRRRTTQPVVPLVEGVLFSGQ